MSPSPIPQYSIHNILHYISPPSHLSEPIPPHLISKSLHQRHHFLNIAPSSPHEYLCWPSQNSALAINLLESFVPPDDDEYVTYPVRYSSDGDWVYAHVHVCSDKGALRIVLQWDEADGWKYHDANVMPFPRESYISLQDAISGLRLNDVNQVKFIEDHTLDGASEKNDADSYWDAYGQESDEDSAESPDVEGESQDGTEDSYWAQYASVHGSGDSTHPSPLIHTRRKLHSVADVKPFHDPDTSSDSPIIFSHPSFQPRRPVEGPSPGQLTDRLNAISPRFPFLAAPNGDSTPTAAFDTDNGPVINITDVSSSDGELSVKGEAEEFEESLRQSIRGVLQLWKAGRQKYSVKPSAGRQDENELFLRIVREIVEEP